MNGHYRVPAPRQASVSVNAAEADEMRGVAKVLLVATAVLALALIRLPPPATARAAALPSDFNGDGYADLAIGAPYEDVGAIDTAGAVNVLYGSTRGITAGGDQCWTQDSPGVRGRSEGGDVFGRALASGDFDRDGYADLAVGATADRTTARGRGAVNVLYGSAAGLTAAGDQRWSRDNLAGVPYAPWGFGDALASADFDGDGYWDLAIGSPMANAGSRQWAGAVVLLRGGPDGLRARGLTVLALAMTGVTAVDDREFGEALAAGHLDGDPYTDLAVGVPYGGSGAGSVVLFRGSAGGISTADPQTWDQERLGFPDDPPSGAEYGDEAEFGTSLAIGDFDGDGHGDLAVGAPGECSIFAACDPDYGGFGAAHVIYGSAEGLAATDNQLWHEDVPGVPGVAGQFDWFGDSLAAGDFDGDGVDDLALSNPGEPVGGARGAGAVAILHGGSVGLTAERAQQWTQASAGIRGAPERHDWLGTGLASADFGRSTHDDLAIGVAHEAIGARGNDGMVHVLYGSATGLTGNDSQAWHQGSPGVLGRAENSDTFGWSLTP